MTDPIPSQSQVDNARDLVERAQLKLGKCQTRAILSGAQAKADKAAMDLAARDRDAAQEAFEAMVDRFTLTDDVATATAAIRTALQPPAQRNADDMGMPSPIRETEVPAVDGAEAIATLTAIKADDYVPPRPFGTFQGGTVQAVLKIRGIWQMQVDGEWFECPPYSEGREQFTLPSVGDFVLHHSNWPAADTDKETATDNVRQSTDPVLANGVSRHFAGN